MAPIVKFSSVLERNVPYLFQQLVAALNNSSVVVKFICALNIMCYFLSFSETAVKTICVTPGFIIPPNFWVWTAFTHCFLETRIWLLLANIVTVGVCGKLLEPLWGVMEMLTFFALVNTLVAFLSVMVYIICFTITSDAQYLFSVQIYGLAGFCAAVSVAVKQIMPDHILLSLPCGHFRNKNVPLFVFILSLILWPLGIVKGTYPVMFASGLLSAWVYLRYYQHHRNGMVGDKAEGFAFASFFPSVTQSPILVISDAVLSFLAFVRLCNKPHSKSSLNSRGPTTLNIPTADAHDAERRRQIALRALSERLSKVEKACWSPAVEKSKSSENVGITMPPVLAHQPNLYLPSGPQTCSLQSEHVVEIDSIPFNKQMPS